ncbi:MAG: hypothetical protein ACYSWO_08065 [Planctomycetota bacterium]|jgi:hypothetical protein
MFRKRCSKWLIVGLLLATTVAGADIKEKIAQLDIDKATLSDVIKTFGEPTKYVWGSQTLDKDDLPRRFIIVYPDRFHVFMFNDKVVELRHEGPGTGYAWRGKLRVGDSLEKALNALGRPKETLEGQENRFEDRVLYRDIAGREGHCYYARADQDIRLWFMDYKIGAIYMTRSDYGAGGGGGGGGMKKADIPATSRIDENGRIADKIDYPFVSDRRVIGAWKSVDFVRTKKDFKAGRRGWGGDLYLNHLVFEKDGKIPRTGFTWTKGLVLSKKSKTASTYEIKRMGGATYLFFQWKSGDYTIRHREPSYYVLKKVPLESVKYEPPFGKKADIPSTSTIAENGRIVDKIDYPFVTDAKAIGTWKSVDFVDDPDEFEPDARRFKSDLYLKELVISDNGKTSRAWSWTKGLLLHSGDKTASKYAIKEIAGSTYMFLEWKSGDYTIRYMKPGYYVLKKD